MICAKMLNPHTKHENLVFKYFSCETVSSALFFNVTKPINGKLLTRYVQRGPMAL